MFHWDDLQRIGGAIFGESKIGEELTQNLQQLPLADILQQAGLDPAELANIPSGQVLDALSRAGIDISALSEGQIGELMQSFSSGTAIGGLDIQRFFKS